MADIDAFENAYRRLAATRLAASVGRVEPPPIAEVRASPHGSAGTPRSRLLPRLATMAPRSRPMLRDR